MHSAGHPIAGPINLTRSPGLALSDCDLWPHVGARPARATKAAPKEEVGEPDQAAPMEGVEAPAENLEKPAAKGKAAAKPAAKRATKV